MSKVGLAELPVHTRYSPTAAVQAGFGTAVAGRVDSYWLADHLNSLFPRSMMTPKYFGGARLAPKPTRIWSHGPSWEAWRAAVAGLGCGSASASRMRSRRNPAVTAQAAATLNLMTRGRAILGIGTGEREGNEPYGVDWCKPVARFEEAMATIRALWNSGGELVTRDSPFFPLHNAIFDLPPYKGKWPEIWIAAHMPRMLRITGRYADAWFPAFIFDAKSYAAGLEVIRGAASDAGRDPASIIPANWHIVVTGRSRDEVDEALSSDVMKAIALNLPADIWANHGVRHPLGADFVGGQDLVPQVLDEETVLSYTRDVPLSMFKECMLTGTPDDVIDQFADWRDQGVRYPVVCNISGLQPSLRKGMAASIPLTRILRGLRKL